MRLPVLAVLVLVLCCGRLCGADKSPRTPVDANSAQVQAIAKVASLLIISTHYYFHFSCPYQKRSFVQFATTEIRKLCAHCYWHMKASYENFELTNVVSAEKGVS